MVPVLILLQIVKYTVLYILVVAILAALIVLRKLVVILSASSTLTTVYSGSLPRHDHNQLHCLPEHIMKINPSAVVPLIWTSYSHRFRSQSTFFIHSLIVQSSTLSFGTPSPLRIICSIAYHSRSNKYYFIHPNQQPSTEHYIKKSSEKEGMAG